MESEGKSPLPVRRTQEERRLCTIRKLLDAATDVLVEVGYADASVQAICARAGMSQGALFRHFPTRDALMVAVGQDVGRRTLESFREQFEARRASESPTQLALRLMRECTRSSLNQAWYELFIAARTRPQLREALEPALRAYYDAIVEVARETNPKLAAKLGDAFPMVVRTFIAIYDGESMRRFVFDDDADDRARMAWLSASIPSAPRPRR